MKNNNIDILLGILMLVILGALSVQAATAPSATIATNNYKAVITPIAIFDAATTDSTSTAYTVTGYHHLTFYDLHTTGSATVTLQVSPDNSTWFDVAYITASGFVNLEAVAPYVRATITSCTDCEISAWLCGDSY